MTSYAIQAGALRENPNSGPDGVGVQADIAYTLEARAEVQAVCGIAAPMPRHDNDNTPSTGKPLRFLSVCSGIEAASTAWHPLGWRAVAFSEIEKFPSAVLAHHYPDVPNLGDFTAIDTTKLGQVDILAGGTPCQAFSVAGLRQGLDDARGNLTLKFVELAHELAGYGKTDGNGLRNVVWENVVGVLSDKGNAFGCFLAGLVGADAPIVPPGRWTNAGMVSGPRGRAAWRVLDAQYFGLAQRRRRVIVVADFGNGADPAAVLLIEQGLPRHPPARGEAGKSITHPIAPSIVSSGRGVERTGDTRGQDPVVAVLRGHSDYGDGLPSGRSAGGDCAGGSEALVFAPEIARCVATREGSSQDYESTTMVAIGVTGQTTHALTAEGADASEDGTGRGTPVVCFTAKDYGADASSDLAQTLRAGGFTGSHANGGVMPAIAWAPDTYSTLSASEGGTMTQIMPIVTSAVRRLTPMECERLQGFPDGYTAIPWRGKHADQCPDGPRYKALGNSWAVPKFVWLGRRIAQFMPQAVANDHSAIQDAA